MRQNARKFGLSLAALILAVFLVGTAVLAPCLVSAEDGRDGVTIRDTSGMEGSGGGEPVGPPLASPGGGDIIFEQPPLEPWIVAYWSDRAEGYLCMDDFWGLTKKIGDIHWYGISQQLAPFSLDCDPTGMEFQIIFYEDSGGYPGEPVATFSNVTPVISLCGVGPSYRFDINALEAPVSLTQGWVSVQSTYSPNGCFFAWITSHTGNNNLIQNGIHAGANLAFALTGAPPPPPNVKYLHSTGGLFNLTAPIGTQWHELYPVFCRHYHLSSWNDTSGDGVLSYCDWIDMYEKPDGAVKPYHVEEVTITLYLRPELNELIRDGFGQIFLGEPMYIELEGGYDPAALTDPIGTQWHEVYPNFCTSYNLTAWDNTGNSTLDFCDYILLIDKESRNVTSWHVEDVAIDIVVCREPPPVGGEAYPVNRASLLAPWIAVGVVLAVGISWYILRRRRVQS